MNLFVIFLILILAVTGLSTIWFIVNRAKCVLPADKTPCGTGNAYMCPSPDSQPKCDTDAIVCGPYPPGMDYNTYSDIECNYDSKSQKYAWVGSGTGGGGGGGGETCTVDSNGNLNFKTLHLKNSKYYQQDNKIPAKNYTSYNYITSAQGCMLATCSDGYVVKDDICVPNTDGQYANSVECKQLTRYPGENHDMTEIDTQYKYSYGPDTSGYGKDPIKYCSFVNCAKGPPMKNPVTTGDTEVCMVANSGDIAHCIKPDDLANHILTWGYNPNLRGCIVATCADKFQVSLDQKRCVPICTSEIYTLDESSCTPTGCLDTTNYTWDSTNKTCKPNCSNPDIANKYVNPQGIPLPDGTTFKAYSVLDLTQPLDLQYTCRPTPPITGNPYGGCGDNDHTSFMITKDKLYCSPTINGNTAKWQDGTEKNGTDTGTKGCMACMPRNCPIDALTLDDCIGQVEAECIYTSSYYVDNTDPAKGSFEVTKQTPVETCVTAMTKIKALSKWEQFDEYSPGTPYTDIAQYVTSGKYSGTHTVPTNGRGITIVDTINLRFKTDYSNDNVHIHIDNPQGENTDNLSNYSSDILVITNYNKDYGDINVWGFEDEGVKAYNSFGPGILKARDVFNILATNPIPQYTEGTPTLQISLADEVSRHVGKYNRAVVSISSIIAVNDDGAQVPNSIDYTSLITPLFHPPPNGYGFNF